MFKLLKWAFFLTVWSRSKIKIISVLLIWVGLFIFSQMINDVIEFTDNNALHLIYLKWGVILIFSFISGLLIFKVYLGLFSPAKPQNNALLKSFVKKPQTNDVKERILSKKSLKSKSEQIIDKYKKPV